MKAVPETERANIVAGKESLVQPVIVEGLHAKRFYVPTRFLTRGENIARISDNHYLSCISEQVQTR